MLVAALEAVNSVDLNAPAAVVLQALLHCSYLRPVSTSDSTPQIEAKHTAEHQYEPITIARGSTPANKLTQLSEAAPVRAYHPDVPSLHTADHERGHCSIARNVRFTSKKKKNGKCGLTSSGDDVGLCKWT